jgi:gluconolactonase
MPEAVLSLLESTEPERLATGFSVTDGPLWHPDGFYSFADVRESRLYRLAPGREPELLLEKTRGISGMTFDLQGQVVACEGLGHRVCRLGPDGRVAGVVAERYQDRRFNRPEDIICRSDGSLYFTDSGLRVPLDQRQIASSSVYRVAPEGTVTQIADFECPNGLAFSPDERTLYVANTMWVPYVDALDLDADGNVVRRRRFADLVSRETNGVPDGITVDAEGRVFCAGPGGVWVFAPDGGQLAILRTPEVCSNLTFGGSDLKTLFLTATRSVYALRVKTPGRSHP